MDCLSAALALLNISTIIFADVPADRMYAIRWSTTGLALLGLALAATAFGLGLGYLRSRTGSVYPGIMLHVLVNALSVSAIAFGSYQLPAIIGQAFPSPSFSARSRSSSESMRASASAPLPSPPGVKRSASMYGVGCLRRASANSLA